MLLLQSCNISPDINSGTFHNLRYSFPSSSFVFDNRRMRLHGMLQALYLALQDAESPVCPIASSDIGHSHLDELALITAVEKCRVSQRQPVDLSATRKSCVPLTFHAQVTFLTERTVLSPAANPARNLTVTAWKRSHLYNRCRDFLEAWYKVSVASRV